MSRRDLLDLWAAHLDEAPLTPDERQRLADGLERDTALRQVVLDDWALDGLLRARVLDGESGERFTAGVATLITAGSDDGRFAAQIQQRLGRTGRWRASRARRRWHGVLAAAAALAVAVIAWQWLPTRRAPEIPLAMPDLPTVQGESQRLAIGMTLRPTSALTLRWDDDTSAVLTAGAQLTIADPALGKHLVLDAGTLQMTAKTQPDGRPLRIHTPQAQATVVGTSFTIASDAERTRLAVDHGLVKLASDGHGERAVGAGQTVTADRFGLRAPGQPVFMWEAGRADNPTPTLAKLTTTPDGRPCLQALQDRETTQVVAATFDRKAGWCTVDPRTVVTCRVWIGNSVKWAGFYVQDYARHRHGQWHLPLDQRNTWREVRFTLGDLEGASTPPPVAGDTLHIIMLQAQFAPDAELYVDRITITPPDSPVP